MLSWTSWTHDLPTSFIHLSVPSVINTKPAVRSVSFTQRRVGSSDEFCAHTAVEPSATSDVPTVSRLSSVGVSARTAASRVDTFRRQSSSNSPVSELPAIGAMRPDSRLSADSSTPVCVTTTRRQQRIDLDLRHSAVTVTTNGSRTSPASHESTTRARNGVPIHSTTDTAAHSTSNGTNVPARAVSSYAPRTDRAVAAWNDTSAFPHMTSLVPIGQRRTVSIGNLSKLSDNNNNNNNVPLFRDTANRRVGYGRAGRVGEVARSRPGLAPGSTPRQRQSVPAGPTQRPTMTQRSQKPAVLVKSTSQPSFLALLMSRPSTVGPERTVNNRIKTAATTHTHNDARHPPATTSRQQQQQHDELSDSDDDFDDDEVDDGDEGDSDDEAAKRRMIEDWLIQLQDIDLDRPASPVIEEETPSQTDTAIHIVYDGD